MKSCVIEYIQHNTDGKDSDPEVMYGRNGSDGEDSDPEGGLFFMPETGFPDYIR